MRAPSAKLYPLYDPRDLLPDMQQRLTGSQPCS